MIGEIDKDFYCSADLYDSSNVLKVFNAIEQKQLTGDCIMQCEKCHNYRRKWPTPEQYEEEYGRKYSDNAAVYVLIGAGHTKRSAKEWAIQYYGSVKETYAKDGIAVCACTPWGIPDREWKPS